MQLGHPQPGFSNQSPRLVESD